MPKHFPAYHGDDPYIFISYSHRDTDTVTRIMETLRAQGFNIWYDDGINPGSVWRDEIAMNARRSRWPSPT